MLLFLAEDLANLLGDAVFAQRLAFLDALRYRSSLSFWASCFRVVCGSAMNLANTDEMSRVPLKATRVPARPYLAGRDETTVGKGIASRATFRIKAGRCTVCGQIPDIVSRIFLLSPALCSGRRGTLLRSPSTNSIHARRLASGELSLGDAFAFMSGLYFRGKLAYARHFGADPGGGASVLVITPTRGLQPPETIVTSDVLLEFAGVDLQSAEDRYLGPLMSDARRLHTTLDRNTRIVLLGSIATGKYLEPLSQALANRLCFPSDFVGRGDMSRGGLLLRCVAENRELEYSPFSAVATRRGARPARLAPLPRAPRGGPSY
jgi:hypothetical protein